MARKPSSNPDIPMPITSKPVDFITSSSVWLKGLLVSTALILAGCATQNSAPQAELEGPTSRLYSQREADEIAELLARIEQGKARPGIREADTRHDFVSKAMAYLGTRYKYGGSSPSAGFDCSGLIWYVAKESLGVNLPRVAAEQAKLGKHVARADLERGDLVFFNTAGRRFSHVGIYVGDGKFLHAPSSGGKVRVEAMSQRYWNSRYNGARRLSRLTQLAAG